jgi:peptide/nickel transport system permease protein
MSSLISLEGVTPPAAGRGPSAEPDSTGRETSVLRIVVRTFTENKLAVISLVVLIVIILFCYLGPLVYHSDTMASRLLDTNLPPGKGHPLGTDDSGRDILGRLMVGGQSSIEIGVAVALISASMGALWGALSGFFGGALDAVMMRIVDGLLAIPGLFLFLYLASIVRPNLLLIILVLSAFSWLVPARLIRGETLSLRTREYVQAVKVMGGRSGRIVFRHILPNALGTLIVNATFQVADAILALALLSYLGFGLPPPAATWGGMLSAGITYLYDGYWWQVYPAGVMIVLVVMAFNAIGDAVRDSVEVRLQQR